MKNLFSINQTVFTLILAFVSTGINAQDLKQNSGYVPHVGQEGKDVIWVPTPLELVNKMLKIAEVTPKDFVIDLGSGDGRTVIAAARLGAHAIGIEYNPEMVALSKKKAEEAGVSAMTKFIETDLFGYDLSEATVITMFLLPEINLKLRPKLLDLKPGTRIVSNTFTMGEWEPDYEVTTEENSESWYTALMWIIPAKVEGNWKLDGGELTLRQEFQMIYGTFKSENNISNISDGRLHGDKITFSYNKITYTGQITGKNIMTGSMTEGTVKKDWSATRIE